MAIKQMNPEAAYDVLSADPDAIYLDVRTEGEFARGHPTGAINIPVVFINGPGEFEPNENFRAVVERLLPRNKKLIVGCMSGKRSQRACEILEQAGYTDLTNVVGGFGGQRDASGEVTSPGWKDSGLPVSTDPADRSYSAVRRKAGI